MVTCYGNSGQWHGMRIPVGEKLYCRHARTPFAEEAVLAGSAMRNYLARERKYMVHLQMVVNGGVLAKVCTRE